MPGRRPPAIARPRRSPFRSSHREDALRISVEWITPSTATCLHVMVELAAGERITEHRGKGTDVPSERCTILDDSPPGCPPASP